MMANFPMDDIEAAAGREMQFEAVSRSGTFVFAVAFFAIAVAVPLAIFL